MRRTELSSSVMHYFQDELKIALAVSSPRSAEAPISIIVDECC